LIKAIDSNASVEFIPLDLADRTSISDFASSLKYEKIDYLVNNAGVMGIPSRKLTKEGLEMHWAINHLGHFYLAFLLWPKIIQSDFFRIINVSSRGHRWYLGFFKVIQPDFGNINFETDYDPQMAYSRSKLYNVLFTRALAAKIDPRKGLVASLHPGVVRTDILREMAADGIKGAFF
jgi:NAD(P)-dependent dehydrogenase (short-subunit alcohol dehydrogenase family)